MMEFITDHPFITLVLPIYFTMLYFLIRDIRIQEQHNHLHDGNNIHNPYYHHITALSEPETGLPSGRRGLLAL